MIVIRNLYKSVSWVIFSILRLSKRPLNAFASLEISQEVDPPPLPGHASSSNSFPLSGITVRFPALKNAIPVENLETSSGKFRFSVNLGEESIQKIDAKEASSGGTSVAVTMDDVQSRLEAHVVEEIAKMIADNKFLPENFKLNLPPEIAAFFSGGPSEILVSIDYDALEENVPSDAEMEFRREKRYTVPASELSEAIVRVGVDRHASRMTGERWDYKEDMQRKNNIHDMNDWDFEHANDEDSEDVEYDDELSEEEEEFEGDEQYSTIDHEDILQKLGLLSYPESPGCSPNLETSIKSLIHESLPLSFFRYDCDTIFTELRHHQDTSMWSERAILEELFFSLLGSSAEKILDEESWKYHPLVQHNNWLSERHHCTWGGVTCGSTTIGVGMGTLDTTNDAVGQNLSNECKRSRLKDRHRNRCDDNRHLDQWTCEPCPPADSVTKLDLTLMKFSGILPENLYMLRHLHRLNVMGNTIKGSIPETYEFFEFLEFLDVSKNILSGHLPEHLPVSLTELWLEDNHFSGTIPDSVGALTWLSYFDASNNFLEGSIPSIMGTMTWINSLNLSRNGFTGEIPDFLPTIHLRLLDLSRNYLEGTLPLSVSQLLYALEELDLSSNNLIGTVPDFPHNNRQLVLNLTVNEFTGVIPSTLCYGPYASMFGCDAVMCKAGTFNPAGSASHLGPCMDCIDDEPFLGQTICSSQDYLVGDIDLDGVLSEREVLHLLYTFNDGVAWGPKFTESWSDFVIPTCELPGIKCQETKVTHINLTEATMCSGYKKYNNGCIGLPSEIGLLSQLRSLDLGGPTVRLKGTIPSEIATLANLEYLNLEESALKGSIPSEIARLESLRIINLQNCGLTGYLPPLGSVNSRLEVLNLALNEIRGSIPPSYGHIMHLEELILSRNKLTGTIIDFSRLKKLDNIELYGNALQGSIPKSIGGCSGLKRIDLFSNALTGTIPSEFNDIPSLQIIHLKANYLSGTLPPSLIDNLSHFVWLDVSGNQITGTIPPSYGQSKSLKDLRLGGNKIHGEIAKELCENKGLNDPPAGDNYGCDHILCPLGTISDAGYATSLSGCKPCPEGQSTMHLGSDSCQIFTQKDILKMFYELLGQDSASNWDENYRRDWSSDKPECEWIGVTCEEGEVTGLSFPNSGLFTRSD